MLVQWFPYKFSYNNDVDIEKLKACVWILITGLQKWLLRQIICCGQLTLNVISKSVQYVISPCYVKQANAIEFELNCNILVLNCNLKKIAVFV